MRINLAKHGASFLLVVFFVFWALGSGTTETAVTETEIAQTHYDRGLQYFRSEDWWAAISEFSKAIDLDPNFELAYVNRGSVYHNSGEFARALEDFSKAIEINPNDARFYHRRGRTHARMGKGSVNSFREAFLGGDIDEYTKAIEKYDLALADFNKAIELNPELQEETAGIMVETQQQKEQAESRKAELIARKEANQYDPAKFIIVPNGFRPANYTKADLFDAAATAEKLAISAIARDGTVWPTPSEDFASEVVFVNQNGTDITFRTADNAISRTMKVDGRTGLTAGQRVRIYYSVYHIKDWHIDAIERL
jgi:tetratricopeptide (TPR) repeat protein